MRPIPHCALAVALSCALAAGTAAAQADATARVVDPALMNRAADLAYNREVDRARARNALDTDRAQLGLMRRASTPLIAHAAAVASAASSWVWAIHIETREEPIAWCLPGGKIMVSTGLIDRMKLTPGELAVVLAHAIAHALAGHDADEAVAQYTRRGERDADPNRAALRLADILGKLVPNEPHDVAIEKAADSMALALMAGAAVDPRPAAEAWRKIARAGGATPPGFLALHPMWPQRIAEIEAQIAALLPVYEAALQVQQAAQQKMTPIPLRPGRR